MVSDVGLFSTYQLHSSHTLKYINKYFCNSPGTVICKYLNVYISFTKYMSISVLLLSLNYLGWQYVVWNDEICYQTT